VLSLNSCGKLGGYAGTAVVPVAAFGAAEITFKKLLATARDAA
jgi:hypothetical protein